MEDTRTYITDITTDILDNYFTQVDTLGELLTPDPLRATRIIVNKVQRILDEFEKYCPMTAVCEIHTDGSGFYTFKDNYKEVVEGKVPATDLELIPTTVAKIGGQSVAYSYRLAMTANYWEYARPTLKMMTRKQNAIVSALYHYPIYIVYTEDGRLNKFSHIFGLERKHRQMLYNLMELRFLEMIRSNEQRIKLPTTIEFFNLDYDIQNLEKIVENDIMACQAASISWK